MASPELNQYVYEQISLGYTTNSVIDSLRQAGWSEADIQSALAVAQQTMAKVPEAKGSNKKWLIGCLVAGVVGFVVVPVVVLVGFVVLSLNSANKEADEAKLKSDIKQLQNAVGLYYSDFRSYPTTLRLVEPDYIGELPSYHNKDYYYYGTATTYRICPPNDSDSIFCATEDSLANPFEPVQLEQLSR